MKYAMVLAAALLISMLGGQATAGNCVTPDNANTLATEIAQGLNANRRANGQAELRFNRQLAQAAMRHACDMQVHDFFAHQGSDGSNSQVRVRAAGYRNCIVAENLAWGYPRSEQIISGWMDSPGHRQNMLNARVDEYGIAITQGAKGPYWVLVVGSRC